MSTVCFINGFVLSDEYACFEKKNVLCEDGKIKALFAPSIKPDADEYVDISGKYLVPGFTDAHTHGKVGYDFNTVSSDKIPEVLMGYAKKGVTSLFPTLASATLDDLLAKGDMICAYKDGQINGARVVGVHLEGKYLNPAKKGAHAEELLSAPNAEDVPLILEHMQLPLHVSAAFELDEGEAFISALTKKGATVGLAHTVADYKTASHLYEKYAISLTHMFNAMPPLHHRDGGAVCVGLTTDMFTELICDGIHVSPEMVKLAYRCKGKDRLVLVTDSMEATDSADGQYMIAGQPVIVKDAIARTLDGALAGSTLNFEAAINNLVKFAGADYPSAITCATANPCKMLNVFDSYGSVTSGKFADLIVSDINDDGFKVEEVYVGAGRHDGLHIIV